MPAKKKDETTEKPSGNDGLVYILIYFFMPLSGLIFYLMEKEKKKIRFHAMQSIMLGIVMVACWFLFFLILPLLLIPLIWLYGLYVGYKEYEGETVRIAMIAEYADKYV